uniref:Vacuolar ATPase assembly protein VMA22 n=1 Tax=Leptobrachium leishanense TaxID=445787 RepID=A0A8C5Q652_9ANUR
MAPAPQDELSTVCRKLDLLTLRLMDDLEHLRSKRDALNRLIEKGWLSLSQSRYSMGQKFVSALQYKQDMVPSVSVQDRQTCDGSTVFEVERESVTGGNRGEVEEIGAAEAVLRHRRGPTKAEPQGDPTKLPVISSCQDPLRWFGILVPQTLRQAQSSFHEGILLAADVASLQNHIEQIYIQYRSLTAQKHLLQAP